MIMKTFTKKRLCSTIPITLAIERCGQDSPWWAQEPVYGNLQTAFLTKLSSHGTDIDRRGLRTKRKEENVGMVGLLLSV